MNGQQGNSQVNGLVGQSVPTRSTVRLMVHDQRLCKCEPDSQAQFPNLRTGFALAKSPHRRHPFVEPADACAAERLATGVLVFPALGVSIILMRKRAVSGLSAQRSNSGRSKLSAQRSYGSG